MSIALMPFGVSGLEKGIPIVLVQGGLSARRGISMGKKASNRPNRPKSVQTRPSVQNQVLQRIATLKNSGMGFRKISKQLAKEGLANISKGTVANYWKQRALLLIEIDFL